MAIAKKRPSDDELEELLFEGGFSTSTDDLPSSDPVVVTHMVTSLNKIKPYDKNPRREKNKKYEDIRASISALKALTTPLCITRRPGEGFYMIAFGGNTRLDILNELYSETSDEAFNRVHCLFVPWKSESSVLSAHLIENTMRDGMVLIDKAYAVQELKNDLEDELGEALTDYEFVKKSKKTGYIISARHLRRYNYAIRLDQLIPKALRSGMGHSKIDFIKKIEKAYLDYCSGSVAAEDFDGLFSAAMSRCDDSEYWDIEEVRVNLDRQLAELTGLKSRFIRIEVDAILFDRPGSIEYNQPPQHTVLVGLSTTNSKVSPQKLTGSNETEASGRFTDEGGAELETNEKLRESVSSADSELTEKVTAITDMPIHALWGKGYDLALRIARSLGLNSDLILPAMCGMGFYLEIPRGGLVTVHAEKDKKRYVEPSRKSMAWWLLLSISEQYSERSHSMWGHTEHYHILSDEAGQGLTSLLGSDPFLSMYCIDFLQNTIEIGDRAFTDIFTLMRNSRAIKEKYSAEEIWVEGLDDNIKKAHFIQESEHEKN